MRARSIDVCAHCGTRIRHTETMVRRTGQIFCCRNCAEAEAEASLRDQLELELGEAVDDQDT